MLRRFLLVSWLVSSVVIAAGCTSEVSLYVDAKTDMVAGEEFTFVRTELFRDAPTSGASPIATEDSPVTSADASAFLTGVRVAELDDLEPGTVFVRVALMDADGSIALERLAAVTLDTARAVTLVLARDCGGVVCPMPGDDPSLVSCRGGECVPAACTEVDRDACPTDECTADDDCPAPAASCARARCESGVCLSSGDDGACPDEEWCSPELGCRPRAATRDAGMPDGGTADAGAPDGGPGVDGGPGCTMDTCAGLGADCGAPPDGCGGSLDCGACSGAEVCGGGDLPYVCAVPPLVDETPPSVSILSGPADPTSSTAASFTFTGSDTGGSGLARFECRLDAGSWSACTTPHARSSIGEGSHTFRLRGFDGAGNVSAIDTWTWAVDTTPPTVVLMGPADASPTSYTATPSLPFTYTCDDGSGSGCVAGSQSCSVDGVSSTSTSSLTCGWLSGDVEVGNSGAFAFGGHTLVVWATDAAGNVGTDSRSFDVTRCATDLQFPNRSSGGFTRGGCCTGLVNTSGWTDFSFGFWHPRGDGSCRPMSDWDAQAFECIWGGASCPSGYQTTQAWGAGCTSARGRTTCVSSLAAAQRYCGTDGGSGSQTPLHGRASEGWHPPPSAGCSSGVMSSSTLMQRVCAQDVCWSSVDAAGSRWSISASEVCKSGLVRHCRTNPFAAAAACVCLPTGTPAPYTSDGRG